jgi:hypothetical protein
VSVWYGKSIFKQAKEAFSQAKMGDGLTDTHNVLMSAYPDIPEWVYLTWLAAFSIFAVMVTTFTPFYMPWYLTSKVRWATIFAILMGVVFTVPIGLVQAISGWQVGLNVLTEFVIGLLIPGETLAVIGFKSLGYNIVIQALNLVSDLKLGHYMVLN